MNKFFRVVDRLAVTAAYIGVAFIAALMLMYLVDVLGRLLISRQIKGSFEVAQFFLCVISFSAYCYAQIRRGHIHMGFVINRFPRQVRYAVTALNFILCAAICVITVYALWRQGNFAYATNRATVVLLIPMSPLYYLNAVFMAIFTLTIVSDIIRCFLALGGNAAARESIDKICL